ncbi:hypothetical protein LX16_4379 [Stackebrandtia albiflava]|uniref:TIGR01777 family protein n=1 Tax=Stackebrandtia albiflava TaxID=406432 RepID=A0A562URD7_9ACTN|nr:TIGR01777 family oxidoreductase [Stackebrandtia albiflava]TWJ08158.1 hypothetical protein LX16_4379 [Stackebrandtia albiflava]
MNRRFSTVIDAPLSEVFGWHERPGALQRLTPPWQQLKVVREAGSLRDGVAVIALPGGLKWVARHGAYRPPHRFVDTLDTSLPVKWRHSHEFTEVDGGRTRLTDRVDTNLPGRLLPAMFRYRHGQLADDLAAHRRARAWTPESSAPPVVAVTGSSGLIGTALTAFLTTGGIEVVRLVRHPTDRPGHRHWNPDNPSPDLLSGVDVVVHLAGEPLTGRFTETHRKRVRGSRVGPTERLARLAAATPNGPRALVSASAIGYYGPDRGDTELTESAAPGGGFLADVVGDWEAATAPASAAGLRVVNIRTGIVQSPAGGSLRLLFPLFAAGLGGRIGDGRQWTSWIGIDDLVDVYHRAIVDDGLSGPVNAVAPEPVRNDEYTRVLGGVLRRPTLLPVPSWGPKLLLGGQGAEEIAAASQRVVPGRLRDLGHRYRHPRLRDCLTHLFGKAG